MTRNQEHCAAKVGTTKKNPRTKTTDLTKRTKKETGQKRGDEQEVGNKRAVKQRAC